MKNLNLCRSQLPFALVPIRHSSERVPGHHYRGFAGKPLLHRIMDTVLACPSIDHLVVDTPSPT